MFISWHVRPESANSLSKCLTNAIPSRIRVSKRSPIHSHDRQVVHARLRHAARQSVVLGGEFLSASRILRELLQGRLQAVGDSFGQETLEELLGIQRWPNTKRALLAVWRLCCSPLGGRAISRRLCSPPSILCGQL